MQVFSILAFLAIGAGSVEHLGRKITRLSPERLSFLVEGLNEIIGD